MANDYRYFPEPDLQPLFLTNHYVNEIRKSLPALPNELYEKYTVQLGLPEYDASVITADKEVAMYFEELVTHTDNYKAASNWLMGSVKSYLNENGISITQLGIQPANLAVLIALIDSGKINNSLAAQKLFPAMLAEPGKSPEQLAKQLN